LAKKRGLLFSFKIMVFKIVVTLGKISLSLSNGHNWILHGWKTRVKSLPKLMTMVFLV